MGCWSEKNCGDLGFKFENIKDGDETFQIELSSELFGSNQTGTARTSLPLGASKRAALTSPLFFEDFPCLHARNSANLVRAEVKSIALSNQNRIAAHRRERASKYTKKYLLACISVL